MPFRSVMLVIHIKNVIDGWTPSQDLQWKMSYHQQNLHGKISFWYIVIAQKLIKTKGTIFMTNFAELLYSDYEDSRKDDAVKWSRLSLRFARLCWVTAFLCETICFNVAILSGSWFLLSNLEVPSLVTSR